MGQNIHCGLHAQTKLAPLTSQIMSCMEYLLSNATIIVLVNGNGHINKVKLRRARLVRGLVTTFGGSATQVFIQAHSAWPSLRV